MNALPAKRARLPWLAAGIFLVLAGCNQGEPTHVRPDGPSVLWEGRTQPHAAHGSFWAPRADVAAERYSTSSDRRAVVRRDVQSDRRLAPCSPQTESSTGT